MLSLEVLKETVAHLVARMKKANGMEVDVPPLTKSYSEYLSKYEMKKVSTLFPMILCIRTTTIRRT